MDKAFECKDDELHRIDSFIIAYQYMLHPRKLKGIELDDVSVI